ncbi:hypothetical protein BCEN4_940021 [Burkholderia cenocepacia]|nr:hypothetical protein BCEN4_940021 [Burkholderia cenocepacia]
MIRTASCRVGHCTPARRTALAPAPGAVGAERAAARRATGKRGLGSAPPRRYTPTIPVTAPRSPVSS